jgi:hypothetical protein
MDLRTVRKINSKVNKTNHFRVKMSNLADKVTMMLTLMTCLLMVMVNKKSWKKSSTSSDLVSRPSSNTKHNFKKMNRDMPKVLIIIFKRGTS